MTLKKMKLMNSPRLYVTPEIAENLPKKLHSPYLKSVAEQVIKDADKLLRTKPLKESVRPTYQQGTRLINTRLQCLTTAWVLTKKRSYIQSALKHLQGLTEWNQISCEARVDTPPETILPFCLSYGELSSTIGLMYDLFRAKLTDEEKKVVFNFLDKFLMKAAINCLDNPPWWANKSWSNWNGVCAGGIGIMALSFYDDYKDSQKLIDFVEKSLGEYFKSYIENGGGCHEGTGYWNYGMTYAMRYLLSWENATGKKHPALAIKEIGKSLFFPLDFDGITFGDNDGWGPMAFFFLLSKRLRKYKAIVNAAARLPEKSSQGKQAIASGNLLYAADVIPSVEKMRKLKREHMKKKVPVARVYDGMDWAALADDETYPSMRLALRGGSSEVQGHGMLDLLSFRCRVNGELMITDQQDGGYMPSTFTKRGNDLYGRSIASKSTLFVDGLGCAPNSTCDKTEVIKDKGIIGIRIDASSIFLPRWKKSMFIGRLVLMVDSSYWLVIDQVTSNRISNKHWMEARLHTMAENSSTRNSISLKSGKERMQITFASLNDGVLRESTGMPSQPQIPQTKIYRWMSKDCYADNLQVTALNPGNKKLGLNVSSGEKQGYCIEISSPGKRKRIINLTSNLKLKKK